ncbi:MAG: CRISPR-associated helicase/endonuclease Cas3, partial [Nitrososphaerales archaeon]
YTPRIIYSLPFITIIEQNYEVLKKVLLPISGAGGKVPSELLLAHHHLSGVKFSTANNEYDINESEFLIESWSSEIVVTTFVQFFYSIISDNRGMSVKFHNIVNSIVILDEIQSLPYDLWELVRFAILFLANAFHTYFIFTTATLPMLLRENEIEEAVDHKELIYKRLHRVELLYEQEPCSLERAAHQTAELINQSSAIRILIVMNTLNDWARFGEFLETKFASEDVKGVRFLYLSSAITPKERWERIEEIRSFVPNDSIQRLIVVSTQVIEAGVDLDFDLAFRDIGPLPSVLQICGRCNRSWKSYSPHPVRIFEVLNERGYGIHRSADLVYGSFLIDKTKQTLDGRKRIDEADFLELCNSFYDAIEKSASKDTARKIISAVASLDFRQKTVFKEFKLIEEDNVNFFVLLDQDARTLWSKYSGCIAQSQKETGSLNKFLSFRLSFSKIKTDFYMYVVSVPRHIAESRGLADNDESKPFIVVEAGEYSSKFGIVSSELPN